MEAYIIYSQSLENFIIDLSSYTVILIILFFLYFIKYINKKILIFFSLYSVTPFFFNDVLITSTDLWDQYTNSHYLLDFRKNLFTGDYADNYKLLNSPNKVKIILGSHLYGILPFFYFNSINSIAFANKLILALTSIYIIKKNYIKKSHIFFLLLYPSTIIYSSLSLKEVLLGVTSAWILILLIERKYFFSILTFTICFFIRPQFYGFIMAFIIYYLISLKLLSNKIILLIFNLLIIFPFVFYVNEILDILNYYIFVYNQEDAWWGGILNDDKVNYLEFSSISIINNLNIVFNKLILNWPVVLKYKILFTIENLILFYYIFKNIPSDLRRSKLQTYTCLLYLFTIIISLYIIFPNLLPLHRFFYPFIFFFIISSKIYLKNENSPYYK